MLEVRSDEVAGGQGRHEVQFPGQHGPAHDPGQLAGVLPGVGGVGALHAQHLEARGLGGQHCTAAHCANLNKQAQSL